MTHASIGEPFECGWDEAKALGGEDIAYTTIRLEAVGHDWAVFRGGDGQSLTIAFGSCQQLENFFDNLRIK